MPLDVVCWHVLIIHNNGYSMILSHTDTMYFDMHTDFPSITLARPALLLPFPSQGPSCFHLARECVCECAYKCACMWVCKYCVNVCKCECVCMHESVWVCMWVYECACVYMHECACVCWCVCENICECMSVPVRVWVCVLVCLWELMSFIRIVCKNTGKGLFT